MKSVDWNQKANMREQILFTVSMLVFCFMFLKMLYPPICQKKDQVNQNYQTLLNEKNEIVNFLASTPVLLQTESLSRKKGIKMKILYGDIKSVFNDVNSLLAQITSKEFLRGVEVDKVSYQDPVVDNGYSKIDFFMSLHGSFIQVLQCLDRLDQFPALFSLENVGFEIDSKNVQVLNANIQGRFYKAGGNP